MKQKLSNNPKEMLVIGLMSGTSVDGIDAGLVRIRPDFTFEFIDGIVYEYSPLMIERIFELFEKHVSIKHLCQTNFLIGEYFAQAVLALCEKTGISTSDIDLIGSHGQTVYHYPFDKKFEHYSLKSTLQIGESSVIAQKTGILTVSDFRTKDIAAGGDGAPLVPYFDEIFFKKDGLNSAIQNIGGISNVTMVGENIDTMAFDTGPGNMIIDYCAKKFFGVPYDKDGKIAKSGKVDEDWLALLMQNGYFKLSPPKTTGRELFGLQFIERFLNSNPPSDARDVMATVTAFTAKTIANAYKDFILPNNKIDRVILGGGGAYNSTIIKMLASEFDNKIPIMTHEDFGISNKFKEVIAFAFLAYAAYFDMANNVKSATGAKSDVIMGKFTKPY
ncbi:MAG: anhydro-N-acetylmuramic acid kinase [Candidatus Gastranaerophilales bacterium]|nr:anhydro-N-acetylmuramic acid kinase [Candidatus Gastranaerophilales bacterium]